MRWSVHKANQPLLPVQKKVRQYACIDMFRHQGGDYLTGQQSGIFFKALAKPDQVGDRSSGQIPRHFAQSATDVAIMTRPSGPAAWDTAAPKSAVSCKASGKRKPGNPTLFCPVFFASTMTLFLRPHSTTECRAARLMAIAVPHAPAPSTVIFMVFHHTTDATFMLQAHPVPLPDYRFAPFVAGDVHDSKPRN